MTTTLQKQLSVLLGQLHQYGAILTVKNGKLSVYTRQHLPDELLATIQAIKSAAVTVMTDWPTVQSPGPCPVCYCPSFRMGDAGTLLCRSCQPMGDADESQVIHVVTNFDGVAWEPLPARAFPKSKQKSQRDTSD